MRVLLTNDDGFEAEGLLEIRQALISTFDNVVTVAPDRNRSGFSRASTYSRPLSVKLIEGGRHPIYSCDGTPVDCVRVALLGGLVVEPVLVVSGINHGANLADDIVRSGTVGAGLEAGEFGVSSLCLSQQVPTGSFAVNQPAELPTTGSGFEFGYAARHGAAVATMMAASEVTGVVLNVNYPGQSSAVGVSITRPGQRAFRGAPFGSWSPDNSAQSMFVFGEPGEVFPEHGDPRGTDIAALREGLISVTPLGPMSTLDASRPPWLAEYLDRLASIAVRRA